MNLPLYYSRGRREMDLVSLGDVSLIQAREYATQWRFILHEGRDPIKKNNSDYK